MARLVVSPAQSSQVSLPSIGPGSILPFHSLIARCLVPSLSTGTMASLHVMPSQVASQQSDPVKLFSGKKLTQLFMQFFFGQQCVSESQLDHLVEAYNQHYREKVNNKGVSKQPLITNCNKTLRPVGFQIKRIFDPVTDTYYYILSNEMEDSLSNQNSWSQKESAFYYTLLDEIIKSFLESDDIEIDPDAIDYRFMSIGITAATNLARKAGVTMVLGEKLIKNWIAQHWFGKIGSDRITIGVRSMSIMSSYLNSKFSIFTCFTCNFACLIGVVCPKCKLCQHYHCSLESNFRDDQSFCPTCNMNMGDVTRILPPVREETNENADTTIETD